VVPVERFIAEARSRGIPVLLDGAQATPHMPVDVQALDCDFYCFSGHKMCGPTGIGALWARRETLDGMPPYQGGGEMISEVTVHGSSWAAVPHKFEAGTPNIAGAIGFGEAISYLSDLGAENLAAHEAELSAYALERLGAVEGLRIYGPTTPEDRISVFSFTLGDIHPHDLSTILDRQGIAIRAGHHCNQPLMDHMGVSATARASFYLYNTLEEVDALVDGLAMAADVFGGIS
jgi:cysteine desulfurase/selenocysteine lyase